MIFDAAVPSGGTGGIAAVVRDHTGFVLTEKKLGIDLDVETAELLAARLANSLAKKMDLHQIILKGLLTSN